MDSSILWKFSDNNTFVSYKTDSAISNIACNAFNINKIKDDELFIAQLYTINVNRNGYLGHKC